MALKVIHIADRDKLNREAEARALWEEVLKPKWDMEARKKANKIRAQLNLPPLPEDMDNTAA